MAWAYTKNARIQLLKKTILKNQEVKKSQQPNQEMVEEDLRGQVLKVFMSDSVYVMFYVMRRIVSLYRMDVAFNLEI